GTSPDLPVHQLIHGRARPGAAVMSNKFPNKPPRTGLGSAIVRIPSIAVPSVAAVAGMVAGLGLTGLTGTAANATTVTTVTNAVQSTSAALPAVLTRNKIYRSGTARPMNCPTPSVRPGSAASIKRFQQALARCANRFWATRFKSAGLRYSAPKLQITTGTQSVCGRITSNGAQYCPQQRTVAIRI